MKYTRIHAIKSTVTKAVAYICNPDKTEQQLLVDSFGCHPDTAKHDFDYALSRTKSSDKNLAYHLIQSFAKGEVSLEEAHRIGIELTDKLLGGKYSYVVATHTDKGHPHNHIIFCAADNIDHKKYNVCKKTIITSDSSAMNYAKNTIFLSSSKVAEKVKSMWIGKPSRKASRGRNAYRKISTNALNWQNHTMISCIELLLFAPAFIESKLLFFIMKISFSFNDVPL